MGVRERETLEHNVCYIPANPPGATGSLRVICNTFKQIKPHLIAIPSAAKSRKLSEEAFREVTHPVLTLIHLLLFTSFVM